MDDTTIAMLDQATLRRSDDLVKADLELTCNGCEAVICDAEAGDTLEVLARTAFDHLTVCERAVT